MLSTYYPFHSVRSIHLHSQRSVLLGGPTFISPSPSRWNLHGMSRHIKEVLSVKQFRVDWSRSSRRSPRFSCLVSHNGPESSSIPVVTLYSVLYSVRRGPGQCQQSQSMVSARLSASATKKPVLSSNGYFISPHQYAFSPRQSNPPRLYPLTRIGYWKYKMSRTELYSGGKALF